VLEVKGTRLAFTTDSFVVTPICFSGGDIGRLAVNGTVNDLAMSGAHPLYLSFVFILEEGLPLIDLERIVPSMQQACNAVERMLEQMWRHRDGKKAQIVGEVVADHPGMIVMRTDIGGTRIVDLPLREQLPHIC
jgi:hydrogenase maturation factor